MTLGAIAATAYLLTGLLIVIVLAPTVYRDTRYARIEIGRWALPVFLIICAVFVTFWPLFMLPSQRRNRG